MKLNYVKKLDDGFKILRQVLKQEFHLSTNLIIKLKKAKAIYVNSSFTYLDTPLHDGDVISVNIDFDEDNSNIVSSKMFLDILFEDDYMLILNKPPRMAVHPSMEHYFNSLSNGVKYYYDSINLHRKIRPVNRLDRNTSGIVIFAKNEYIQERLASQMQKFQFQKQYIAICEGIFSQKNGTINAPIARKEGSIIERCVSPNGKNSITNYKVIKENPIQNFSTLLVYLQTGRTHQIRVHMAYIGHPLIGDDLYGHKSNYIDRQALHSYKVSFFHPITNQFMEIIAPLPDDMKF